MKSNTTNVQKPSTSAGVRKPWFLGFGFHKLKIEDFDIRTTPANEKYAGERYTITLKGRTEDMDDFTGHEGCAYQKVSFKPGWGMIMDDEAGILEGVAIVKEAKETKTRAPYSLEKTSAELIDSLGVIAGAVGLAEEFGNIEGETVLEYLENVCELLKTGSYAWFALKEVDSLGNNGKVYSEVSVNFNKVYALEDVTDVKEVADGYDVLFAESTRTWAYTKDKYNFVKLDVTKPNDAPIDPMAEAAPLADDGFGNVDGMDTDDLPF